MAYSSGTVKGKYHQKIRETRIDENEWAAMHWKALVQNYRRAPHFEEMQRKSVLADAMEAIIGAVFLDTGYEGTKKVVLQLFQKRILSLA